MSTEVLTGIPVGTDPFLELQYRAGPGYPPIERFIYPKLATTPTKIKASRDLSKLAVVTTLRREDVDGLGSAADTPPMTGVRAISSNDRFVLLGGTSTIPPALYEKTMLFYRETGAAPDLPTTTYFTHAAFSLGGRYLFAVHADTPDEVQVYAWSSDDVDDPNGQFNLGDPLLISGNVTNLMITPLNSYLVVRWAGSSKFYGLMDLLAPLVSTPAGEFLGFNDVETEGLFAPTGADVTVYSFSAETFTLIDSLPSSTGTLRKARYSPDGVVVVLMGRPTTGTEMPRFYTKVASDYVYSRGIAHANSSSWDFTDVVFRDDDQFAVASADSSGSRLELYARDEIVPDPFTPATTPFTGGLGQTSGSTSRSGIADYFATLTGVFHDDGSTITDVTPSGFTHASQIAVSVSHNGEFFGAARSSGTPVLVMFQRAGAVFTSVAVPSASVPAGLRAIAISEDGSRCAIAGWASSTATIQFYDRNMTTGAWTASGSAFTFASLSTVIKMQFLGNTVMALSGFPGLHIFRHTGAWSEVTAPAIPSSFTLNHGGIAWHPSGSYFAVMSNASSGGPWRLSIFSWSGSAFTFLYQTPDIALGAAVAYWLDYSPDGSYLAMASNSAAISYRVWSISGYTPTTFVLPSAPPLTTGMRNVCWSVSTFTLFTSTTSYHYDYDLSGVMQSYALETTVATAGTTLATYLTYSPDGTVVHFGREADSRSIYSTTPYAALTGLSFSPDYGPTEVWDILYSASGKMVIFKSPDGVEFASRKNPGSDFRNSKTFSGVFVFMFDLDGDTYVARDWSEHMIGSVVKDLSFAEAGRIFTYHLDIGLGAPGDAARGRLLFDTMTDHEVLGFVGQIWEADMTNSLIAFKPSGTHFVVTHEHLVTDDPIITLHELTAGPGVYAFDTQDTEFAAFGPPDFSECDDVVVAHGGLPQMTFFIHDGVAGALVPNPVIINWDYEGVILDVVYRRDCGGLLILTPDKLFPLEPDGDDLTPDEPVDLDEPLEPDVDDDKPTIEGDDDDDFFIDPKDPADPGDPTFYEWDPPDPPTNISYVPYSVVTVTFRVMSIPS